MMGWESQTLLLRKGISFYTCAGILQLGSGSKSNPAVLGIKFSFWKCNDSEAAIQGQLDPPNIHKSTNCPAVLGVSSSRSGDSQAWSDQEPFAG